MKKQRINAACKHAIAHLHVVIKHFLICTVSFLFFIICIHFKLFSIFSLHCGTMYCNWYCLWRASGVCLWVCYHNNSKFYGFVGKGSDHLQLIKFQPTCTPGRGSVAGRNLGPPNNFWTKRAIRFKFGTDIEHGASLRRDHKMTPKWAWPGSRGLILGPP